ncbi:hypothetical protein [Trinickia mobilis]|uniref:hypothetical protein n=1 Tax=Trinickia mobilis TaxID=2816356 RepID=UPI001A8C0291|nr:hypothetical protein [Trinickia mobilis]
MTSVRLSTIGAAHAANAPAAAAATGLDAAGKARNAGPARGPSLTGYRRGDAVAAHLRLNRQVTGAQQTLAFLSRAASQLAQVKGAVVARISGKTQDDHAVGERIAQFAACWKTRSAATGGRLSAQLEYGEAASARQAFRICGLDAYSTQSHKPETLVFHTAASSAPMLVRFDADMYGDEQAARLNYALARGGISAASDGAGRITFSIPEAAWPELQASLTIAGGGIRFPSGRPNRIQAEAVPGSIAPQNWKTDSDAGLRESLRGVADALKQIARVQTALQTKLDRAQQTIGRAAGAAEQRRADGCSAQFKAQLSSADGFESFAAAAQAAAHIDAGRVRSLLKLPIPMRAANEPGQAAARPAAAGVRRSGS